MQADNLTLVVSLADFAALLSAALRGPRRWQSGAVTTAPLISEISTFSLAASPPPDRTQVALALYTGWGLNATNLRCVGRYSGTAWRREGGTTEGKWDNGGRQAEGGGFET